MDLTPTQTRRDAALAWLLGRINYERTHVIPYQERQLKLDRMRQLLTKLGSPHAGMRIVHIAGTKGKGSTAKMTAAMLQACGYRTGVYSSPHLEKIEERFAVDGLPCTGEDLVTLVDRIRPVVAAMDAECGDPAEGPTFFDVATAMAFVHFADCQVDAAVIEVGLGGRLDSTNVCLPLVTAITSISRDHTKQLGDTLAAIAGEKAGIAKPGVPMVCGESKPEPQQVIAEAARRQGCRLIQIGTDFGYARRRTPQGALVDLWSRDGEFQALRGVMLGPPGEHQAQNAAVAFAIAGELLAQGWSLPESACRAALEGLRLPGRVEVFPGEPTIVIDAAHNEASANALVSALDDLRAFRSRTLVFAASRDKDVKSIVAVLAPHFDRVLVTRYLENPRAVPPEELASIFEAHCPAEVIHNPTDALADALADAHANDLVCVTGSFFIAAELRPIVAARSV